MTVVPDHRAISHSLGIVGIIYKTKDSGGAQVATVVGLLVQSGKKDWWIPDDQYIVRYTPHWMRPFLSISRRYANLFSTEHITQPKKQNGALFKRYTK